MMKTVQGYAGLREQAEVCDPTAQVKARLTVGPDPVEVTNREVAEITRHALASRLAYSIIEDPQNTSEAYSVFIVLGGTAAQMDAFASAMAAI